MYLHKYLCTVSTCTGNLPLILLRGATLLAGPALLVSKMCSQTLQKRAETEYQHKKT